MLGQFKEHYANLLTSAAGLFLVGVGAHIGTPGGWRISLGLLALLSFAAWAGNLRRSRLIKDTPTSRVASAAQGYVELAGQGKVFTGQQLVARSTGRPCLWYRYRVERKNGDQWEMVEQGRSDDTFLLDDGSGECVIDPDGAEIYTRHRRSWQEGDYRHTEWLLVPGDPLYAIGDFASIGGAHAELDLRKDVGNLLAEWKQDKPRLLSRFDRDQNGEIDPHEWEEARKEALKQVQAEHLEIRLRDSIPVLRQPRDGRLYLIANLTEEELTRKYVLWGAFHLVVFAGAIASLAYWFM